ncbi:MAG: hypothetical protein ACE5HO_21140 [bacterium]
MQITEPMTMITDYLLAAVAIVFSLRLFRIGRSRRQTSVLLWSAAFVAVSVAALAGGTFHGLTNHLNEVAQVALWKATVYSIGLASYFMLAGTVGATISRPLLAWVHVLVLLKFMAFAVWMSTHNDFSYVIYDYAPAMVAVLLLAAYSWFKQRLTSSSWLIAGVLASFAAAALQLSTIRLHEFFNHNDLYHVVQIGANYLLFRGAGLLKDR